MKDLNELRRKRGSLIEQGRALLDKAEKEKRELTAEESQQWDAMEKDQEKLRVEVEREERQQKLDKERETVPEPTPLHNPEERGNGNEVKPRATEVYNKAYRSYLANGLRNITAEELRALQSDSDTAGGFVTTPQQLANGLIKAVDDIVFVRQFATKFTVEKAESVGAPVLDSDPADADWTSEIKTGSEDSDMDFAKRELRPHPVAKRIKVANKLIRVSVLNIDALVRDRLAYKFGITHEKGFMTGNGAERPLGLFTASAQGISTGRDVSTGNTTTAIQADNLIEVKYTLKPQYQMRPGTRWIFHRDALKQIRKLKDGNGQYLWQAGLTADKPDTILEVPFLASEYAPNTFTTGLYVGLLGDLSFYWIVDALDMQIQVLDQLYAETAQTGYIGRMESDGAPVLEEAFVRVKLT
jgi:HK97 family phage major capsid protein